MSSSKSSSGEMMIEDMIQRIVDYVKESEERIERVVDRMHASRDSSGSASSKASKASKSDERAMKYQLKLAEEFRKYVEQTAIRIIMILKEVGNIKTLMIKSYAQQIMTLNNEDVRAFIASIPNMDIAPQEYMQFTQNDQLGFYVLSHFFLYGTYIQPLQAVGADKLYWKEMCKEILNSMGATQIIQSFFQFISKHQDVIEMVGLNPQDMIDTLRVKFTTELHAVYTMMLSLPVKVSIGSNNFVYRFDNAYMLCRDYLTKSHQHDFVASVSQYLRGMELQIGHTTGVQVGGSKKKTNAKSTKTGFYFKRFSKLGSRRTRFA